ncbi:MAG: HDIG domain-containing protein [Candidatus Shapirobacteria bacterium]|nr:HDIG domain-containing protein [Candidatus Shapirobacteria bacterium]
MALRELYSLAEQYSVEFLEKCRPEWDVPHTRAVFHYAKLLTRAARQDMVVIPTAAWLHDIGYYGLFHGDSKDLAAVMDRKERHMVVGAQMAMEFISREDVAKLISIDQGERIVHLVRVHDKLEELTQLDEKILAMADTLGAIDVRRVKPTFKGEDKARYLEKELHGRRELIFVTDLGERLLRKIIPKFENYRG